MGGSLIRQIASGAEIGYGVNIYEIQPPQQITGVRTNVAGMVADLPWGPVNTLTKITSGGEFYDTFCPSVFGAANDYPAMRALLNKTFVGGLNVVRIAATGQVTAFKTDTGTGTVTITAKYPGALGNSINRQWLAATDLDAAKRDLLITIGSNYSARYKNLTVSTVTAVSDPYVVITAGSLTVFPAAGAAAPLATGADGTAVASDYVGTVDAPKGITLFYGQSAEANVLFVAECPTALVDTVNAGLYAYATTVKKGMVVLCSTPADTQANAIADVASYRSDRCVYTYPRAVTKNFFDPNLANVTVDGNAFVAAAICSVDPEVSPGGAPGAPALVGIIDLENQGISTSGYDALNAAGIAPIMISNALGPIIRKGVTTSLTSGLTQIFRRRMADYIQLSIADAAEHFAEKPLDIDLPSAQLGPNTAPLVGEVQQFLSGLYNDQRIASMSNSMPFVVDPFSGNAQANIDAGRWYLITRVKLHSALDELVLMNEIGEGVTL